MEKTAEASPTTGDTEEPDYTKVFSSLEKQISSLKGSFDKGFSSIDKEISSIEKELGSLKTSFDTDKLSLKTVETDINALKREVKALSRKVANLESMDQDKEEGFVQEEEVDPDILEKPVEVVDMNPPKKKSNEPGMGLDFAFLFVLFSLLPIVGYYLFGQ